MKEIKEIEIDGDRLFLSKSGNRYKVVYPIKIDGKINWKNLLSGGNWLNLLWIALGVGIILGCVFEYSNVLKVANECLKVNPSIIPN